jgi:hypothetical protein
VLRCAVQQVDTRVESQPSKHLNSSSSSSRRTHA